MPELNLPTNAIAARAKPTPGTAAAVNGTADADPASPPTVAAVVPAVPANTDGRTEGGPSAVPSPETVFAAAI